MKTGRLSMTTQLFPYANRIILYAHCNLWPRVALAVSRLDNANVPDHIRADLLAFSVVLIHRSLAPCAGWRWGRAAGGGAGRAPDTCLASHRSHLPGLCRNRCLFPLSSFPGDHSAQLAEQSTCRVLLQGSFHILLLFMLKDGFFGRFGSPRFSILLNDVLFHFQAYSDFYICTFSRCSRDCQRSSRKL